MTDSPAFGDAEETRQTAFLSEKEWFSFGDETSVAEEWERDGKLRMNACKDWTIDGDDQGSSKQPFLVSRAVLLV